MIILWTSYLHWHYLYFCFTSTNLINIDIIPICGVFFIHGWSRKYPINNRVTSRDQGWEARALVTDILRWWKLHANWLRRMCSDQSTHWSQWLMKESRREKESSFMPIFGSIEWVTSVTDWSCRRGCLLCLLHDRQWVGIIQSVFQWKKNNLNQCPIPIPSYTLCGWLNPTTGGHA